MGLMCVGWVGLDFEPLPLKKREIKNVWRKSFAVSNYILPG